MTTGAGMLMYKTVPMKRALKKIISNVDRMRKYAQNQEIYKNVPLAEETLVMLEQLDDPEEGPLGKAYACHAILEQVPEYDTPRLALKLLRRELAWLNESTEKSDWLLAGDIEADIAKALKDFDELNEEVDLEDGTWMPLDPDALFDEPDNKEAV